MRAVVAPRRQFSAIAMPSPISLEYRGAVGPEALTEEVPFVFGLSGIFVLATLLISVFHLLFASALMALVVNRKLHVDSRTTTVLLVSDICIVGGAVAVALLKNHRFEVRVGPQGICAVRKGVVDRECEWSRLRVVAMGPFGQFPVLADQSGKPFPFFLKECLHLEGPLARQVMRNVKQNLLSTSAVTKARPEVRVSRLPSAAPVLAICMASMFAVVVVVVLGVIDPRKLAMLAIPFGFGAVLMLGVARLNKRDSDRSPNSTSGPELELATFVSERRGRYVAEDMPAGVWFGYVAPAALRATEERRIVGGALFLTGLLTLTFGLYGIYLASIAKSMYAVLSPFQLAAGLHIIVTDIQVRRTMKARFRRTASGFDIDRNDSVVECQILKAPDTDRSAVRYVGAVAWVLRGDDGRTYRIDPRFVVETGSPPSRLQSRRGS